MNMNSISKAQNRILLVTIALIVSFASLMILLTVTQNRRPAAETEAPDDPGTARSAQTSVAERPHVFPESGTTEPTTKETESAAVPPKSAEVAAVEDVLPEFISPVTGTVSRAHSVDVPIFSVTMNDYRTHTGVDIAASLGTAVRAAADGEIIEVWEDPMMGKCLSIRHSGGAVSVYKNLAPEVPENIVSGAAVKAGETIGAVGESALIELGESSHLHYELQIDGTAADPADFMLIGGADTAFEG